MAFLIYGARRAELIVPTGVSDVVHKPRIGRDGVGELAGELPFEGITKLRHVTETHGVSIAAGDLQLLDGKWYVTHVGLLAVLPRSLSKQIGARTSLEAIAQLARLRQPARGPESYVGHLPFSGFWRRMRLLTSGRNIPRRRR